MKTKKTYNLLIFLLSACLAIVSLTVAQCPASGEDGGGENSAPVAVFPQSSDQLLVLNAGSLDVNGGYLWDGEWSYVLNDTYYVFPFSDVVDYWGIHTDTLPASHSECLYYVENPESDFYRPPLTGWAAGTGTAPAPMLVGPGALYLEGHPPGEYTFDIGETAYANYLYVDADGDPEGATQFQWYRGDTETGPWTALSGETEPTYLLTAGDDMKWLRVEVTPVAQTGTLEGETVSSPAEEFFRNM